MENKHTPFMHMKIDWSGITGVWTCGKCGTSGLELSREATREAMRQHTYDNHTLIEARDKYNGISS